MNKEEIRQFKSLLKQGSLRHMNIILDDKFQKSLLEIIKDYEQKDKQLDQLTNNWNELEEDINNQLMMTRKFDDYNEGYFDATLHYYNKMNEIKEHNSEKL